MACLSSNTTLSVELVSVLADWWLSVGGTDGDGDEVVGGVDSEGGGNWDEAVELDWSLTLPTTNRWGLSDDNGGGPIPAVV